MALAFYISHPQIIVDPDILVPNWSLSEVGLARLVAIADEGWVTSLGKIYASTETKAIETAQALANDRRIPCTYSAEMGEIDRASTGYVPHDEHERLADALFAQPTESAHGWERAIDAQARIFAGVTEVLSRDTFAGPIAFVGHGGVGTLLACKLEGLAIDRQYDQPGGGHVFAFDRETSRIAFHWTPLEDVAAKLGDLSRT